MLLRAQPSARGCFFFSRRLRVRWSIDVLARQSFSSTQIDSLSCGSELTQRYCGVPAISSDYSAYSKLRTGLEEAHPLFVGQFCIHWYAISVLPHSSEQKELGLAAALTYRSSLWKRTMRSSRELSVRLHDSKQPSREISVRLHDSSLHEKYLLDCMTAAFTRIIR